MDAEEMESQLFFSNQRRCTVEEVGAFRNYHRKHSHVAGVVLPLTADHAVLTGAIVKGSDTIGCLKTFFGSVGRARCRIIHGTDRFSVMQAADLLRRQDYGEDPDVQSLCSTVELYKALFKTTGSDPKVTIVKSANDCLVVDGNKTAVAGFLHASESAPSTFELPVYFLHVDQTIDWLL